MNFWSCLLASPTPFAQFMNMMNALLGEYLDKFNNLDFS